jgi:hypothetical protein
MGKMIHTGYSIETYKHNLSKMSNRELKSTSNELTLAVLKCGYITKEQRENMDMIKKEQFKRMGL